MDAETAGGAPVTDAPESSDANASEINDSPETDAVDSPQGEHASAVLRELGISDEVRDLVEPQRKQPTDEDENTDTTERPAAPGEKEGDDNADGDPAAGGKDAKGAKKEGGKDKGVPKDGTAKDGEEEDEPLEAEQKTWPAGAIKMMDKRRHQRDAAREEARQLREQLAQATRPAAVATADDPLAAIDSPAAMEAAIQEYRDLREWAQENPDGKAEVIVGKNADGSPILKDYTAKDMAAIVARTTRILEEQIPKKIRLLGEQSLHEKVAKERLPEMFEEGTEANRFFKMALSADPRTQAGYANMIRWAWLGRQADIAAHGKNGDGKEKKVDPKVAPFLRKHPPQAPGVPAARVPNNRDDARGGAKREAGPSKETVDKFIADGGGDAALENLIAAESAAQSRDRSEVLV